MMVTYPDDIMQAAREAFKQVLLKEGGFSEQAIDDVYAPLTGGSDDHMPVMTAALAIATERARVEELEAELGKAHAKGYDEGLEAAAREAQKFSSLFVFQPVYIDAIRALKKGG